MQDKRSGKLSGMGVTADNDFLDIKQIIHCMSSQFLSVAILNMDDVDGKTEYWSDVLAIL